MEVDTTQTTVIVIATVCIIITRQIIDTHITIEMTAVDRLTEVLECQDIRGQIHFQRNFRVDDGTTQTSMVEDIMTITHIKALQT